MRVSLILSVCAALVTSSAACAQDEAPCKRLWRNVFMPYAPEALQTGHDGPLSFGADDEFECVGAPGSCAAKFKIGIGNSAENLKPMKISELCHREKDLTTCNLVGGQVADFVTDKSHYALVLKSDERVTLSGSFLTADRVLPWKLGTHAVGYFHCIETK